MRKFLILLIFMSSSAHAKTDFSGLWEGFNDVTASHILELDAEGKGFYSFSISGVLDKDSVIPIKMGDLEYIDGFYKLSANKGKTDLNIIVLFAPNLSEELSVITILRSSDDNIAMSLSWSLTKNHGSLQNERLYNFSKKAL